jgi:hypothetical protein
VKEVLEAQVVCKRNEGALMLQRKQGALLKGALLGGAWSIAMKEWENIVAFKNTTMSKAKQGTTL